MPSLPHLVLLALPALSLAGGCSSTPPAPPPIEVTGALRADAAGSLAWPPARAVAVVLRDSLAFIACGAAGIRVVDVSLPEQPREIAALLNVPADQLALVGDTLFALRGGAGWFHHGSASRIDVVDPAAPQVLEQVEADFGSGLDCTGEGGTLVALADGAARLRGGKAKALESIPGLADADPVDAVLLRRGALYAFSAGDLRSSLAVIDAASGRRVGELKAPKAAAAPALARRAGRTGADLAATGDVLLAADGSGVLALLARDPAAPELLGHLRIDLAFGVAADGATGLAVTGDVVVLDLAEPLQPAAACAIDCGGAALDAAIQGELAAVVLGEGGLQLFRVARREPAAAGP